MQVQMPSNALMSDKGFNVPTKYRVLNKALMLDEGFGPTTYRNFIEELRNSREEIAGTISHKYVIPESEPCSWLDIHLICGDCTIILRVDPRNLYVRGYSTTTNKDSEFWEFSDSSLIYGSKPLPYSGSFLRDGGLCSAASADGFYFEPGDTPVDILQYIELSNRHLRRAIQYLVTHEPSLNPPQSARCLLSIILMITEAARIELIAECVVGNLWTSITVTLTMQSILTALSIGNFTEPIKTYVPVRFSFVSESFLNTSIASYVSKSASSTSFDETIVSIYYVVGKEIYGHEKSRKIYGTVKLLDFNNNVIHTVYNRSSDKFEIKREGECLSLITSFELVDGTVSFVVEVDLMDDDGEIAKGEFVFDEYTSTFDKHLEHYVLGKHCKVGVGYSVIKFAFGAAIDVVIINNHDVESSAYVHGSITASYHLNNSSESPIRLMLFEKSENDCARVSSQEPIPLTGRVFPVPLKQNLKISVHLWDHDSLSLISCGFVEVFPAIGTQLRNIIDEHRQVQVSITCLPL